MLILRLTQTMASLWTFEISLKHNCLPAIKILMSLSQTGWNHVYKFLYLVTSMGPATADLFTTVPRGSHYYTIPWNLWFNSLLLIPRNTLIVYYLWFWYIYAHPFLNLFGLELSIQLSKNVNMLHFLCSQRHSDTSFTCGFLTKTGHSRHSTQYLYLFCIPVIHFYILKIKISANHDLLHTRDAFVH